MKPKNIIINKILKKTKNIIINKIMIIKLMNIKNGN